MIQRDHVENFLRLNGISATAEEHKIRSVLLSAQWNQQDVEAAIMILRGETQDPELTISSIHALLHTDNPVAPETLTALLGVDHTLKQNELRPKTLTEKLHTEYVIPHWFVVFILSIVVTIVVIFFTMYIMNLGTFYSPIE